MSASKRQRELLKRNRLLVRQEGLAERDVGKVILSLGDELARRITPGANEPLLGIVDELRPDMERVIRARLLQTSLIFGEITLKRLEGVVPKSYYPALAPGVGPVRGRDFVDLEQKGFWETFQETITSWTNLHALARAVTVTVTIKESIRSVLLQGQEEGWGEAILARMIQDRAQLLSRVNAARIARTEMHTASTVGTDEAARSTNLNMIKEWASAEDARVRLSHAIADKQEVSLDEAFSVGGIDLMMPGDPNVNAPQEICNCRCQALYHPVIGGQVIR